MAFISLIRRFTLLGAATATLSGVTRAQAVSLVSGLSVFAQRLNCTLAASSAAGNLLAVGASNYGIQPTLSLR